MSEHVLIVTDGPDGPRLRYSIECPGVTDDCRSWTECDECPPRTDESDEKMLDDSEAHGVEHRYLDSGWCVPTDTCFLTLYSELADSAADAELTIPGRWPVTFDIEDDGEVLNLYPTPGGPE